ncbi:YeeE/YedE family protein [Acetobacteraceae bacterium KSS8]|uniref:YeeE/YedE family protein n=1 Tax=Endosaccharibacter trunci TaxID=2812733 RepID=A0ABT1W941_9PROT|nr:YeeE/YedE family protein [Acetobacteraceae bacterium KSS8]
MSARPFARITVSLTAGALFGVGLAVSGMIDPARVLGFLDLAGRRWDASLLFVLGGAVATALPFVALARRMASPALDVAFRLPTQSRIDIRLVVGAALFGTGWGLTGLCPGPAVAGLATELPALGIFVLAMVTGMVVNDRLIARLWT